MGNLHGKAVLLVAHDFPPVRSPQAIRALRFLHALTAGGARVTVLTRTDPLASPSTETHPDGTIIIRCSPAPLENLIDWASRRSRHRVGEQAMRKESGQPSGLPISSSELNWKGRIAKKMRALADIACFPDGRMWWARAAESALSKCFQSGAHFDIALIMHEPAASLLLWQSLEARQIPWAADLADPVLAPYTPWLWRGRALRLESTVLERCHGASVTNVSTALMLERRHGRAASSFSILPQGFDLRTARATAARNSDRLRLLYTGRFYDFRRPEPLLDAVELVPNAELWIAGPEMPRAVREAESKTNGRIRVLGELDHESVLQLQTDADVLVSIGNRGTEQTPGKAMEYLGAGRPILHLWQDAPDEVARLLDETQRGVHCRASVGDVSAKLQELARLKAAGILEDAFDLSSESVAMHSWDQVGRHLIDMLEGIVQSDLPSNNGTAVRPQ